MLVEAVLHGDLGEGVVANETRAEVGELTRSAVGFLGYEEDSDQIIKDGVSQELQAFVRIGGLVAAVTRVRHGLE